MPHDGKFFETIHVEIQHTFPRFAGQQVYAINASNLKAMEAEAREATKELVPDQRCIVCTEDVSAGKTFLTSEHLVCEGLGFGWSALTSGTGTCDQCNQRFGEFETEWLRQGTMGAYRPFYVADGKNEPPAYYAPQKAGHKIKLQQKDGTFLIEIDTNYFKGDMKELSGVGQITFNIVAGEPRTEWVSLALHKAALLPLWLVWGPMVFHPALAPLKEFLRAPSENNHRPYHEKLLEAAPPGARFSFFFRWAPHGEATESKTGLYQVDSIACRLQIHHMAYVINLAGEFPSEIPSFERRDWSDPTQPPKKVPMPLSFGVDGLKKG